MVNRPVRPAACRVCLVAFVAWLAHAGLVVGQQMRFPTTPPAEAVPSASPPSTFATPGTSGLSGGPSGPSGGATGSTQPGGGWTAPGTLPATPAPSSTPGLLPVTPGAVPGPSVTYPGPGAIQPPPSAWDPYAPPGSMPPPALTSPSYSSSPTSPTMPDWAMPAKMQRFLDELRMDYHYLSPRGSKKFGTNDLELTSTFAFPMFYNTETPLRVTPGFAFHWWEGPSQQGAVIPGILGRLPPRVYDAYLDATWDPHVVGPLGAELGVRVGVYSDFQKVTSDSLRYMGHGLFVWDMPPNLTLKGGIVYLDRVRIKILPAGGVVWKPHKDLEFDLIFPYPKISRRMTTFGNTDWRIYVRGEYGGGSWAIKPDKIAGPVDQVDYNDLRCALGFEFERASRLSGLTEIGLAFDRELVVRSTGAKYSPSTTIFLRAGLVY